MRHPDLSQPVDKLSLVEAAHEGVYYHGSPVRIGKFDLAYVGNGHDQNGPGFYFTDSVFEKLWIEFYRDREAAYCRNVAKEGWDGVLTDRQFFGGVQHVVVLNPDAIVIERVVPYQDAVSSDYKV